MPTLLVLSAIFAGATPTPPPAFRTSKFARLAVRDTDNTWRDMTYFCHQCDVSVKAGTADVSKFGDKGKTVVNLPFESGQVSIQGFFDAGTNGPDQVFNRLIDQRPSRGLTPYADVTSQSNYGQVLFCPATATSGRTFLADVVWSEYAQTNPVANVVGFTVRATVNDSALVPVLSTYDQYVVHAPTTDVFASTWLADGTGALTFDGLIGTTK